MPVYLCRSVYDYECLCTRLNKCAWVCTSNMWIQIYKCIVETCVIHIEKAERKKDLGLLQWQRLLSKANLILNSPNIETLTILRTNHKTIIWNVEVYYVVQMR